jgi:hypothetical protein
LRRALVVAVQFAGCRDIRAFALCLCAYGLAAFRALSPCLQLALVFHFLRERIAPIAKGDSPVRDSARRVLRQHRVESFNGAAELEGMKQRCRPVKFLLRRFVARCGKVHRAQFFAVQMLMLLLLRLRQGARGQQGKKYKRNGLHSSHSLLSSEQYNRGGSCFAEMMMVRRLKGEMLSKVIDWHTAGRI